MTGMRQQLGWNGAEGSDRKARNHRPIFTLVFVMLVALSFAGCVEPTEHTESYENVQCRILDKGWDGNNVTYEVEVVKLIGSYQELDGDRRLENGDRITLIHDPHIVIHEEIGYDTFIKVDIQRTRKSGSTEDDPYVITDLTEIRDPHLAPKLIVIGFFLVFFSYVGVKMWLSSLGNEGRANILYNTFYSEVTCPVCKGSADIMIGARKILPFDVRMQAECDECGYDLFLPAQMDPKRPLYGASSGQILRFQVLATISTVVLSLIGTVFFSTVLIDLFRSLGFEFSTLGSIFLIFLGGLISFLGIVVIYSLLKTDLIRNLNERRIVRSIWHQRKIARAGHRTDPGSDE